MNPSRWGRFQAEAVLSFYPIIERPDTVNGNRLLGLPGERFCLLEADELVKKRLAKKAEDRYQSVAEFLEAIEGPCGR